MPDICNLVTPAPHSSRAIRVLCLGTGITALLLGVLGIFLPLLPTTPFILLAAACFARSSIRLHDWLLAQRIAGPVIREWRDRRCMPPGIKPWAYLLMAVSFGVSITLMESLGYRAGLAVLALILGGLLWRVPVCKRRSVTGANEAMVTSDTIN